MSDKNTVLERLTKRDEARLDRIYKAHKARVEAESTVEDENYFSGTFKVKTEQIEQLLSEVPTMDTNAMRSHFDNVKKEIRDLQKNAIAATYYLTDYNVRKCFCILQNLETKCYEMEDVYVPKKRFGFTRRKLPRSLCHKADSPDERDGAGHNETDRWNEKLYGFDSKESAVLAMDDEQLHLRDVTLSNLSSCTVGLRGVMGTLHLTNLQHCVVLAGPVTSSVFVDKCSNCKIVTACQQLRMHETTACDIYLHVTSKGIVEDCSEIAIAPYNLRYDGLDQHFSESKLDAHSNNWDKLDDFNWLAPDVPSPYWSIMKPERRVADWSEWWTKVPI